MTAPAASVTLVPFVTSLHNHLLERWLAEPHVVEWWGHTTPAQALDAAADGAARIICAGDACVGFIRWHTLQRAELDTAGTKPTASPARPINSSRTRVETSWDHWRAVCLHTLRAGQRRTPTASKLADPLTTDNPPYTKD